MTPSDWLAITGIIASAAVTYHLAIKQRLFARAKVQLSLLTSEGRDWPWAVVLGIPDRDSEYYACDIPLVIQTADVALHNMWLQLSYPRQRHYSDYMHLFSEGFRPDFDKISITTLASRTDSQYEQDLLRLDEKHFFGDIVVFNDSELRVADDPAVIPSSTGQITMTLRFENHREIKRKFWLIAVRSESYEDLERQVAPVLEALYAKDRVTLRFAYSGTKVLLRRSAQRRVELCQLGFSRKTTKLAYDLSPHETRECGYAETFPLKAVSVSSVVGRKG